MKRLRQRRILNAYVEISNIKKSHKESHARLMVLYTYLKNLEGQVHIDSEAINLGDFMVMVNASIRDHDSTLVKLNDAELQLRSALN